MIPKGLRAVIFDFDGVIVDSEPLHFRLFQQLFAEEGIALTREAYDAHYLGMDDQDCFTTVLEAHGRFSAVSKIPELIDRKSAMLLGELGNGVPLLPGAAELIHGLAKSVPLAICSGALRHEIEVMLKEARLSSAFLGIVSAEDVARGKPDPEGYQAALALINRTNKPVPPIPADACLVIEDSLAGIEAARAAGMRCLAVANSYPCSELKSHGANKVVATLEGTSLANLTSLFSDSW